MLTFDNVQYADITFEVLCPGCTKGGRNIAFAGAFFANVATM